VAYKSVEVSHGDVSVTKFVGDGEPIFNKNIPIELNCVIFWMQEETTCTLAYGIYKLYALVRLHVNLPKCYMVGDVGQAMQAGGKVPCLAHKLVKEIIGITIE